MWATVKARLQGLSLSRWGPSSWGVTERLLLLTVALSVALRVAWILYAHPHPLDGGGRFDDSRFYFLSARRLADGDGFLSARSLSNGDGSQFPLIAEATAAWPPGYSFLLAGMFKVLDFFKLFGASDDWVLRAIVDAGRAVNILAAAVTIVLVYAIGRRVFDKPVALVGAFLVAIFPGQIYFTSILLTEVIFTAIALTLIYVLLRLRERGRAPPAWAVLAFGAVMGFSALFRGEAVIIVGLALLFWRWLVPDWRTFAWQASLLIVGVVIAIAPWTIRNAVAMNAFVPITSGVCHHFWHGHNPDAYESLTVSAAIARIQEPYQNLSSTEREIESEQAFCSEASKFIREQPLQEFPLLVKKAYYFLANDSSSLEWIQTKPTIPADDVVHLSRLADFVYFTVLALAVAGAPVWWSRKPELLLLLGVIAGWIVLHMLLFPLPRYHQPIMPIVGLLAAAGLVALWRQSRQRPPPEEGRD